MKRTWTIIGVRDVPSSFKWYQSLFGQPKTPPSHDYFGQILDTDGTVLLCLHQWGAHGHPPLASPGEASPGNGLLLFFRVDDFGPALKRARAFVTRFEEEPHVNSNTQTREFSLRDPDGYYVTISALPAPRRRRPARASKPRKSTAKSKSPLKAGAKAKPPKGAVTLLSGGNPRIAKGDGLAPVRAYIAAMPGWKRNMGRRLDSLIARNVPNVRKAVKWNSPFYGIEGRGWFLSFHVFTRYVKVTFFRGTSLRPVPPGHSKHKEVRYVDIHEDDLLDEAQMATWIRQAAALPGWIP